MSTLCGIIDLGLGNPRSIQTALKKLSINSCLITDPDLIHNASHIILPGVGKFDAMASVLHSGNWIPSLEQAVVVAQKPCMGICLGMQIMCLGSEEGRLPGLGWFDANVLRFQSISPNQKIPHMGWNSLHIQSSSCHVFNTLKNEYSLPRYYFTHSYYVEPSSTSMIASYTDYYGQFASAIFLDNIIGVQFHPEKSHVFGLSLLNHFIHA